MGRNSFKAIEHIKGLNALRVFFCTENGPTFTEKELREGLKEHGIPSNPVFFSKLKEFGIIDRIHEDVYIFSDPDKPIHYKVLQNVYASYHEKVKQYQKTIKENKSLRRSQEEIEIKEAVKLLKSKGFEIYAPVGTLYSKV